MKLVIAEKPSVAMSIAKVLGVKNRKDGYVEGNGYIVSWCVGHLVQLANPDAYDEKYLKWNIEDLPIIPERYIYDVSPGTKKQYQVLKKLLTDKNIAAAVNACDAGREGELIFRLVYNQAKSKLPIKRLWISSMEDSAIKEGFSSLKNGKDYENLYASATARAKADWLIGMNMSRFYTCINKDKYSIGRVQTPTLFMIVDRDDAIDNFVKQKYYTIKLTGEGISFKTSRIDDVSVADDILENKLSFIPGEITIDKVEKKEETKKPPVLYDLTTLQRDANKFFGFTAKDTLDVVQKLYEKKLVTYPRTDSTYLTEDMKDTVTAFLEKRDKAIFEDNFKNIFNNKKVTDHHAIIPTNSSLSADFSQLEDKEVQIYNLIQNRLYIASSSNYIQSTIKATSIIDGVEFTASGKTVIQTGFKIYLEKYKTEEDDEGEEKPIPDLQENQKIMINTKEKEEKYTKPPARYTEATLLKAMELAGKEETKGVEVERAGLGTPATRAGIIETLITRGFVERKKKNLISTTAGKKLISIVEEKLKSPITTAEWELKLADISNGKLTEKEFLDEIKNEITFIIDKEKNASI